MQQLKYLKYRIPYDLIKEKLKSYKNLVIFIDLNSIARGFYNRDVIVLELNRYIETQQLPILLIDELKVFLNNLYSSFKSYNPKFCIFYDLGFCEQNTSISNAYKSNRTNESKSYIQSDEEREIYYQIKNYYFKEIEKQFNKPNLSKVVFLENYETDFIPYYFIKNYKYNNDSNTMNLILSVDKDLLQCCQFKNTYQAVSLYLSSTRQIVSNIYDDHNAVTFISKKFIPDGKITSAYIPLILAIAGDKSDGISGLQKGLGIVNTIKMIKLYDMPFDFTSVYELPSEIQSKKLKLQTNLSLISFERQISRIPESVLKSM